ncbi:hypothetical protein [Streptomyces sp. H72]
MSGKFFEGGDEWCQLRSPLRVEPGGKSDLFGLAIYLQLAGGSEVGEGAGDHFVEIFEF